MIVTPEHAWEMRQAAKKRRDEALEASILAHSERDFAPTGWGMCRLCDNSDTPLWGIFCAVCQDAWEADKEAFRHHVGKHGDAKAWKADSRFFARYHDYLASTKGAKIFGSGFPHDVPDPGETWAMVEDANRGRVE